MSAGNCGIRSLAARLCSIVAADLLRAVGVRRERNQHHARSGSPEGSRRSIPCRDGCRAAQVRRVVFMRCLVRRALQLSAHTPHVAESLSPLGRRSRESRQRLLTGIIRIEKHSHPNPVVCQRPSVSASKHCLSRFRQRLCSLERSLEQRSSGAVRKIMRAALRR